MEGWHPQCSTLSVGFTSLMEGLQWHIHCTTLSHCYLYFFYEGLALQLHPQYSTLFVSVIASLTKGLHAQYPTPYVTVSSLTEGLQWPLSPPPPDIPRCLLVLLRWQWVTTQYYTLSVFLRWQRAYLSISYCLCCFINKRLIASKFHTVFLYYFGHWQRAWSPLPISHSLWQC